MKNYISDYFGLIFYCPMVNEEEDCVFKNIRKLPLNKRLSYINVLTEAEKKTLIDKHRKCLMVREKKVPFSRIAIM
jgi:hypothetical protein